jgi:4-phosphopantoate--beta-alanine ligase
MKHVADPSHPRYKSLLMRAKIEAAAKAGLLAESALIAHGRGEAFDYLLGERTCASAMQATRETAARLMKAEHPIISLNGNTVALAAEELMKCAALIGADVEINIFYRTEKRMELLLSSVSETKDLIKKEIPEGFSADRWSRMVESVRILGSEPNGLIPGLKGPRAKCHSDGILSADVLLVPLEDGDRCEALVAMGAEVIVIDLNPMSRSARMASVTVVDELTRFAVNLFEELKNPGMPDADWDNQSILNSALNEIVQGIAK